MAAVTSRENREYEDGLDLIGLILNTAKRGNS